METLNHILTIQNHVHGDLSSHSSSSHRKRTKFHEQKTARREICETQIRNVESFLCQFHSECVHPKQRETSERMSNNNTITNEQEEEETNLSNLLFIHREFI